MQSTALVPTFRKLIDSRICARCRGPYGDDHICHDQVRHPLVGRFLGELLELGGVEEIDIDTLEGREPWDLSGLTPAQLDHVIAATSVAVSWTAMPRSERTVALAILEHAGVPTDEFQQAAG